MPRRAPIVIAAAIGLALAAAVAWLRRTPASPMFATLGLAGPDATAGGRQCRPVRSFTRYGWVLTARAVCAGPARIAPDSAWRYDGAEVGRLSRRVESVRRAWAVADSLAWRRAQDSVATALARAGGRPRADCPNGSPDAPHAGAPVTVLGFWAFPGYTVRLWATHLLPIVLPARRPGGPPVVLRPPPWRVSVDASPAEPPECGAWYRAWRARRQAVGAPAA